MSSSTVPQHENPYLYGTIGPVPFVLVDDTLVGENSQHASNFDSTALIAGRQHEDLSTHATSRSSPLAYFGENSELASELDFSLSQYFQFPPDGELQEDPQALTSSAFAYPNTARRVEDHQGPSHQMFRFTPALSAPDEQMVTGFRPARRRFATTDPTLIYNLEPSSSMSENHYISQRMVAAVTPLHPGEPSSATSFDVVQSAARSERPVRKKARVRPPQQSSQAEPSQQQPQAMGTSTGAELGPLSRLVKADLNKRVVEYFFTQPMRSYEDDMKFIEDLVAQFAEGSSPSNAVMWRLMHEKGIKETSRKTWQEIVRHFKEVARLTIKHFYNLCTPISERCVLAARWAPQVDAVLRNWRYVDHEVQMDDGTTVIHPFHCPVLSTIMIEAIWVIRPTYHSHISRQENDVQLEKILAFSCAILHWALDSLRGGPEPDFGSSRYSPVYKSALDRLTSLRQGTPGDRALMKSLLSDIWARGEELLLAYAIQ